MLTNFRNQRFH